MKVVEYTYETDPNEELAHIMLLQTGYGTGFEVWEKSFGHYTVENEVTTIVHPIIAVRVVGTVESVGVYTE